MTLFLGEVFPVGRHLERRDLFEGEWTRLGSGSTVGSGGSFEEVDREEGSGEGVRNLRFTSLEAVSRGSGCRWECMEGLGKEGTEIGLGVGVGVDSTAMDEERDPILIGVASLLEDPTIMGVDTLAERMLGITR